MEISSKENLEKYRIMIVEDEPDIAEGLKYLIERMGYSYFVTGIFYNVETKLAKFAPWNKVILYGNPMALLLTSARKCMIYDQTPARKFLLLWMVLSFILSAIGVKIIYKYENSYVKVI